MGRTGLARRKVSMVVAVGLLASLIGAGIGSAPTGALDTNIVGGDPVEYGQYPFQAAILALPFGSDDYHRQFCGGSLVSPKVVVTAAHCLDFVGPGALRLSDLRVVVGRTVLTGPGGYKRGVVAVRKHPGYSSRTFVNTLRSRLVASQTPRSTFAPEVTATSGIVESMASWSS